MACLACERVAAEVRPSAAATTGDLAAAGSVESGVAGSSARREYARRSANRDQRVRSAHPRLGGLILALTDEPQSTRAWARGAVGEEKLAQALAPLTLRGVTLLHDRRIPGSRANIDHIAVGPAGVCVIDAKRYAGRPTLSVAGGVLRARSETLLVGRRDCSKLVTGVVKQVEIVRTALAAVGSSDVPVLAMLAFVDADWPLFGGSFTTHGVRVLWPGKIADHLLTPATLDPARIAALHTSLAHAFPSA